MHIKKEVLDELIKDYKRPEDLIGEKGLLKQLTKALLERAMAAELSYHLGYEKHDPEGYNSGNSRNGSTPKTVKGEFGEMEIETREIARGRSSRGFSRSTSDALRDSTTGFYRCMREA